MSNTSPLILFPSHPAYPNQADPFFTREYKAAKEAGFSVALVHTELQFEGGEVRINKHEPNKRTFYRGWLLKVPSYNALSTHLEHEGSVLSVSPAEYEYSCTFPQWYNDTKLYTADSLYCWKSSLDQEISLDQLIETVGKKFGNRSLILKDFLKSRKEDWFDACFIRDASDAKEVKRIISNFIRIVGDNLTLGLVFREFRKYNQIGIHPKSKMPLINEWRAFVLNGKVFYLCQYWSKSIEAKDVPLPNVEEIEAWVSKVQSPFFAADVAMHEEGHWELIEINDGGTAGLPDEKDSLKFYECLFSNLKGNGNE